jgi:hypothetical protein
MSNNVSLVWGKPVISVGKVAMVLGKNSWVIRRVGCSNLRPVYKGGGLYQFRTQFFRTFTHSIFMIFPSVKSWVLPTINTPNKDDNYLNKPYYC